MSIILDALKKAEGDKDAPATEDADPIERVEKATSTLQAPFAASSAKPARSGSVNKRVVGLMVVALVVMLGVVGGKFLLKPDGPLSFVMGLFNKDAATLSPVVPAANTPVVPVATTPNAAVKPVSEPPKDQNAGAVSETEDSKDKAKPSNNNKSEDSPEVVELKEKAIQSYKEGDVETAVMAYEQLIKLNSTDAELYNNYGVALKKQGKMEEAKKNYLLALTINPNYTQAMNNLAVIYMAESKYVAAKDLLRQAMGLDPAYVDLYLHLAIALEKNGEFEAAKEYYSTFLKMSEKKIDRKVRLQVEERLAQLKDR